MDAAKTEETLKKINEAKKNILNEMSHTIIGQEEVLDLLLIALLAEGHCILHGVPGLAKTLIVQSLAKVLDLSFSRIQFTPDLMPADITGTEIIEENNGKKEFNFFKGPVFANIILADEINRTPPKTQAALLQAMQERSVTLYGKTYNLDLPFFVLATENPIEQEGTYLLPEAQLDRFLFNIDLNYPSIEDEVKIASKKSYFESADLKTVLSKEDLFLFQKFIEEVPISDKIIEYGVKMVDFTRPKENSPQFVKEYISFGAGPRASQNIVIAAKANAALNGSFAVSKDDIDKVAYPILKHRVILNFTAVSSKITPKVVVDEAMKYAKKG